MPNALKTELLHYAEYLLTKSEQTEEDKQASKESVTVKKSLAGSMKGTFVLPLADDFDAPFTFTSQIFLILSLIVTGYLVGGALRQIVTFKSKREFLPSNAPYVLLLAIC